MTMGEMTYYRVGPMPGDRKPQKPDFASWLADPHAQAYSMPGQNELLEWIGETWDDELVEPLIKAIDERNPAANHAFIAIKRGRVAESQGCVPEDIWSLGQTHALTSDRIITQIVFKTTSAFLEAEDDEA